MEKKPTGYWTKETCAQEALKYSTPNEFSKNAGSAYVISKRNGWYDEITTHFIRKHKIHTNGYWDFEHCLEEAKKYNKIKRFQEGNSSAYWAALTKGWLEEICTHMDKERKKWTYDICYNEAKKYKTRGDFYKYCEPAYNAACRNGWLKDYDWMALKLNINGNCDCIYRYFFKEYNAIYIGRTIRPKIRDREHIFSNDSVSRFAIEHDIAIPPMEIIVDNITVEKGRELEAYYIDYYRKQGFTILNKTKAGSIGSLPQRRWTYDACFKEAQKYKTLKDFREKSSVAYAISTREHYTKDFTWLKKCCPYIIDNHKKKWTYEKCAEESKKYSTRPEFKKGSGGAYWAAQRYHWMPTFTWLRKLK